MYSCHSCNLILWMHGILHECHSAGLRNYTARLTPKGVSMWDQLTATDFSPTDEEITWLSDNHCPDDPFDRLVLASILMLYRDNYAQFQVAIGFALEMQRHRNGH